MPQVLRRCPHCRLLFESDEASSSCIVCGITVDGLALPLGGGEATPGSVDGEATGRHAADRSPTTRHEIIRADEESTEQHEMRVVDEATRPREFPRPDDKSD